MSIAVKEPEHKNMGVFTPNNLNVIESTNILRNFERNGTGELLKKPMIEFIRKELVIPIKNKKGNEGSPYEHWSDQHHWSRNWSRWGRSNDS